VGQIEDKVTWAILVKGRTQLLCQSDFVEIVVLFSGEAQHVGILLVDVHCMDDFIHSLDVPVLNGYQVILDEGEALGLLKKLDGAYVVDFGQDGIHQFG
jgi:hypothetical protein